jgi:hypothetical protein
MSETTSARFLVPIFNLVVPCPWKVGGTVFHPGVDARDLITGTPPPPHPKNLHADLVNQTLDSAATGCIAEVPAADDIHQALATVRASLGALRVFLASRAMVAPLPMFGLPGEVADVHVHFVATGEIAGRGFAHRGQFTGTTFTQASVDDWASSEPFQYLSRALEDPEENEGTHRAVVGLRFLDRATIETDDDLKMLFLTTALEAWLLERKAPATPMQLARFVSWFGCGVHGANLCGRHRPICPYLHLRPQVKADEDRLKKLRRLGDVNFAWRCSQWRDAMDWYDARSDTAHGSGGVVDGEMTSTSHFLVSRYLLESILLWLRDHPAHPARDLRRSVDRAKDPAGWSAMLAAIDADPSPEIPPAAE